MDLLISCQEKIIGVANHLKSQGRHMIDDALTWEGVKLFFCIIQIDCDLCVNGAILVLAFAEISMSCILENQNLSLFILLLSENDVDNSSFIPHLLDANYRAKLHFAL